MGSIIGELLGLIVKLVFALVFGLLIIIGVALWRWYWFQSHKPPSTRAPFDIFYPGPSEGAEIDIVAVHGLGANVDYAWKWKDNTGGRPVHWLKDAEMLPADVPGARIMAYNYDSAWHADAPNTRLKECGAELMDCLQDFRKYVPDRPVIFIGHSVGGLVIQDGLVFAKSREKYEPLLNVTVGFIALGCPFRGLTMIFIANIVAFCMGFAGSHRGIIQDLGYNSVALQDKRNELCGIKDDYSIPACCFSEAYKTDLGRRFGIPLMKFEIVSEESACIDSWDRVKLQADHFKMSKFSGRQDRSFVRVSGKIKEMCENATEVLEKRREIAPQKGHFMVPFGRNECFERESILEELLAMIPPSVDGYNCQRTVIYGLGGIGKTQVAVEAAFRLCDKQPECSVFWVPALSVASFENAYRGIGRQLQIKGIDEHNADVKELVKSAFNRESMGKWLLIVDNADDELLFNSGLHNFLPFSHKGSILITTRKRSVAVGFEIQAENIIAIPKLNDRGAVNILQKMVGRSHTYDDESNIKLVRLLDHLPLAIKQASAYMVKNILSTTGYSTLPASW